MVWRLVVHPTEGGCHIPPSLMLNPIQTKSKTKPNPQEANPQPRTALVRLKTMELRVGYLINVSSSD